MGVDAPRVHLKITPAFPSGKRLASSRCRLCLLKGCERRFWPTSPLSRYCSPECSAAARRWARYRADQRYRSSEQGKERRREQARRYRQRIAEQRAGEQDTAPAAAPSVGDQEAAASQKNVGCLCARPGCYERFAPTDRSPAQKFCSSACRNALRRVQRRERFWRSVLPRTQRQAPRALDSG